MKFYWLLPSALSIFLLSSPASAARLETWRFDANQNRLYFTTEGGVQPTAQLIANPTRLVIDLPRTTLGRSAVNQQIGGAFKSIRVGQFENNTTRLVIELNPGYTLDPQQVLFEGNSPNQWTVQLPTPQRQDSRSGVPSVGSNQREQERPAGTTGQPGVQIQNVQVTEDGFFIRTSGGAPQIEVQRNTDRGLVHIDMEGATISGELRSRDMMMNRHGVGRVIVSQLSASPPVARITLQVTDSKSDWQATASNLGGVVVLPLGNTVASSGGGNNRGEEPSSNDRVTIQAVEFDPNSSQILVKSDQPFTYTSGWNLSSGAYEISIPTAKLADRVKPPTPGSGSPVLWVRVKQQDPQTVLVTVQPAANVRVGLLNQPSPEVLSLPLERAAISSVPPPKSPRPSTPFPVPKPQPTGNGYWTPYPRPVPKARIVVVIDPGHGGPDAGAIGIAGIQEKEIVLDISYRVAAILQQNGVQAVMTRQDDRDLDLEPRVAMADRVNATVFVSIHANSIDMTRPDVNGIETYYYDRGERLARAIHNSILQMTGAPDRRVRQARFYVLRNTTMPAVLVEVGFVTGAADAPKLANDAYRNQMAAAIANGVLQYLLQNR